jgi:hypothetical protein
MRRTTLRQRVKHGYAIGTYTTMTILNHLISHSRSLTGVGLLLSVFCPQGWAEDVSITALFRPDSAQPQLNRFLNTTPLSGYCALYPGQCEDNKTFSLQVPIQFNSSTAIPPNHDSVRQGAMLKVPAQWRELTVYHEKTREPETVRIRITGIGSVYFTENVTQLVGLADEGQPSWVRAHNLLWGMSWVNAPSPCTYSGVGAYGPNRYRFFWKAPLEAACAKQAKFAIPWLRLSHLDFAYELETPNPLGMSSGLYTGSLTYTVGPGGDFDMGDVMLPDSSTLTMNFTLDVQHTLKVEVPPGGNRVELVPQGGWQSWLQQGRKPTRLFRDQTFTISASSRFKMQLECEYTQDGKTCSLREPLSGHFVPLNVGVSLPHGLTDTSGQPVDRRQLLRDGSGTELFQPGFYVDRKPGTLHFEISPGEVSQMIRPGQSRQYSGNVTVIWDSDI